MFRFQLPSLPALIRTARAYAIHSAALALVAVLGWIVGLNSGQPQSANTRGGDAFTAPTWQPFQAGPLRARAAELALFVTDPSEQIAPRVEAKVEPEKPDYSWRFIGTANDGGETVAFIVTGKPAKLLTVSGKDALPNGEQINAIETDKLKYTKDGQTMEANLFERKMK